MSRRSISLCLSLLLAAALAVADDLEGEPVTLHADLRGAREIPRRTSTTASKERWARRSSPSGRPTPSAPPKGARI